MKEKEYIYNYIKKYLCEDGKNIECVTCYHTYDMEKVKEKRDEILLFFDTFFNIDKYVMKLDDLLKDKNDKNWNLLESLEDLEIFNILVGLGIAVNLFKDSILDRFHVIMSLDKYGMFLNPQNIDLSSEDAIENFLISIKYYVLHLYYFNINNDTYDYMKSISIEDELSEEDKRDLLLLWINESKIEINRDDIKRIDEYLKKDFDGFINTVVIAFEYNVESFILTLRLDPKFRYMNMINKLVKLYTDKDLSDLEKKKELSLIV